MPRGAESVVALLGGLRENGLCTTYPHVRACGRKMVEHCQARGVDPAKLCVQFAVRHPDLTTCIIGSGDPDNVRKWVRWLDEPYDEQAVIEVERILRPVLDRNAIYGRPENNDPVH